MLNELFCSVLVFCLIDVHNQQPIVERFILVFYRDGDFAGFSAFADFFSVLSIFRISAVSIFLHSNQRERNEEKKCLQNNPNRASERSAEKLLSKISLTEPQLCEPLNSERHAQCTLSFC